MTRTILIILSASISYHSLFAQNTKRDSELANPRLTSKFDPFKNRVNTSEHAFVNIFMGTLTGAVFGASTGLAFYNTNDKAASQDQLALFSGGLALLGAVTGGILTIFEARQSQQFTLGKPLNNKTWYGGVLGALVGGLAGLIPYSSSGNTDDIVNFVGYGTAIGLMIAWVWQGFDYFGHSTIDLNTGYSPRFNSFNLSLDQRF